MAEVGGAQKHTSLTNRRFVMEVVDEDMAAVLRKKTGWERLKIVDALYEGALRLVEWNVRSNHPEWNDSQVRIAVAKRIADATY